MDGDARRRRQRDRSADEVDLGPSCAGRGSNRITHLAGTVIGQAPDWVYRLEGRSGRNQHPGAAERAAGDERLQVFDDLVRFQHAPRAGFATGLLAARWSEQSHAVSREGGGVAAGCRLIPHGMVHRRGQQDGCPGGKAQCAQQVIGCAGCQPGQKVGAGWCHHHQIGPAGHLDMAHTGLCLGVEQTRPDRPTADRLQGQGGDKGLGGLRHYHLHLGLLVAQSAHQFNRLVGGDAPGDPDQDVLATEDSHKTQCNCCRTGGKLAPPAGQ